MREMLEWSTVGSGRGGWNGMDIPPWNGFIVPDAGFIPAMVVQIHQQLDLLGRWINLSIHGRRSTDGAFTGMRGTISIHPYREITSTSSFPQIFSEYRAEE